MHKILSRIPHHYIALLACIGVMLGLFVGKAIVSISVTLFLINALINNDAAANIKAFINNKAFVVFGWLFVCYCISGLWSADTNAWAEKVFMHLPYLTIGIGLQCLAPANRKHFHYLFAFFIILCIVGCIYSLNNYYLHKAAIDLSYNYSKVIPTPFKNDHIRFSMAVLIALILSVHLWVEYKSVKLRLALLFIISLLVIYLHVLAVKTGVIGLYLLMLLVIVRSIFYKKNVILSVMLLACLCILPLLAYRFSVTFKAKVHYFKYSVHEIINNPKSQSEISDEGRIISYFTALDVWQNNILLGAGAGDMRLAMDKQYDIKYGEGVVQKKMLPHNQALVMALVAGVFGLIAFIAMLLVPLFMHYSKHYLFWAFWLIFLIPLIVEPLHETQIGLTIHVFFLLLLFKYIDYSPKYNK